MTETTAGKKPQEEGGGGIAISNIVGPNLFGGDEVNRGYDTSPFFPGATLDSPSSHDDDKPAAPNTPSA